MSDEFADLTDRIRERVEPDTAEREALDSAVDTLVERAQTAVAGFPVAAEILLVGSTARDTWLAGDRDIDLFVCFPPTIEREQLETWGLQVGHELLPDGHEEFAEHPYVVGEHSGFKVDLVPCYNVDDAAAIQSAVDRTPFHTRYVRERLTDELANDVRVCKQFFSAIGVYGSDLRTKGFSGFLTELLVLEHGGFRELVEAAADWQPPVRLDPADHGNASESASPSRSEVVDEVDRPFDDPLVVIDPTDPERNVAAVLSETNVARLQHFARDLLDEPRESLFTPERPESLDEPTVSERFQERGTTPLAVHFEAPDVVEDQLWPQLERSRSGIADELDRRGFEVFRTAAFAEDDTGTDSGVGDGPKEAVLLFELAVAQRPNVERHEGPPIHVREHAERFYDTYADNEAVDGPFIDGERYIVERDTEFVSAAGFLESDAIFEVALGAHVESSLEAEYDVLAEDDVASLAGTFGEQLASYLAPTPRGD